MQTLLIVDDDDAMRRLIKMRLSDSYQAIDTGDPVQALGLALEHKPAAILLDLMMPQCSGFELCQSLHTLSYTSRIPIFVLSGESASKYRDYVSALGACAYFEKPIDFEQLRSRLGSELEKTPTERRAHVRVLLKLAVKLKGMDAAGRLFEQLTTTDNISAGGFLCSLSLDVQEGTVLQVFLSVAGRDRYVGRVRTIRREAPNTPWQRYGCQFTERSAEWILQD
jgi:DNA-binding response OmpR family regulator